MARVTKPTSGTVISKADFGDALIDDYVSLTDTTEQSLASNLNIGAYLLKTTNWSLKNHASYLRVRDAADTASGSIRAGSIYVDTSLLVNVIADYSGGAIDMTDATVNLKAGSTMDSDALCRIKTGTYTGDGSTSQGITGVGFSPKIVMIVRDTASDSGYGQIAIMTDQSTRATVATANGGGGSADIAVKDNRVDSLDADGFTVDDDGADAFPNANTVTYDYIAWG